MRYADPGFGFVPICVPHLRAKDQISAKPMFEDWYADWHWFEDTNANQAATVIQCCIRGAKSWQVKKKLEMRKRQHALKTKEDVETKARSAWNLLRAEAATIIQATFRRRIIRRAQLALTALRLVGYWAPDKHYSTQLSKKEAGNGLAVARATFFDVCNDRKCDEIDNLALAADKAWDWLEELGKGDEESKEESEERLQLCKLW